MHTSASLQPSSHRSSGSEPAVLTLSIFGVRVNIRVDDPSHVDRIRQCLPAGSAGGAFDRVDRTYEFLRNAPGWSGRRTAGSDAGNWHLLADRTLVGQAGDLLDLCERFKADLELFLAVRARTHVIVRAGVVAWQGRAIVVLGRAVSERTTLVAALIGLGAEYDSDEYAVLDSNGLISPFPRQQPIGQSTEVRGAHERREPGEAAPLPIGCIVVTEYQPGTVWHPRHLSPGEGVLALLSHSVAARHQPGFLLRTFRAAVRGAVTLAGPRGDATELASCLLNQSAGSPSASDVTG